MNEKDLPDNARALWLKSMHAIEIRNYGYAISLLQAVLKDFPMFLDGRKRLRKVEIISSKGKKSFLSGLSTASLKGTSMIKKDPKAAMELAEKSLETDPFNPQINHLLKEAAKAAGYPEIAAFALETIVEGAPDTKTMHELGLHYLSMGVPDKAVEIYSKIAEINPADLAAVKNSKDAAATASMKSGGWEQAQSYRDLIKDKDQAVSLEQQSRVVKSTEMIDQQIGELTPEWEQAQDNVDLSRRIARLWEDRFDQEGDEESFNGALYFYQHVNGILSGSDPSIVRKLSDLKLKQLDLHMKPLEAWLTEWENSDHEDAAQAREQFDAMKKEKAGLLIDDAKKRVERNPTDLQLRFELGEQLFNAGQYRAAVQELQKARQNPNARLRAMNLLGQCYTEMNMLDLAIKQFQDSASEIVAMDSTKKEILYKLGLIYERTGKREEYLKCMKDIYEVDYGYRDVAQRVEQSYAA